MTKKLKSYADLNIDGIVQYREAHLIISFNLLMPTFLIFSSLIFIHLRMCFILFQIICLRWGAEEKNNVEVLEIKRER